MGIIRNKLNIVLKIANFLGDLNHMIYLNSKKICLVNMLYYIFCAKFWECLKYLSNRDLPKNYFGSIQALLSEVSSFHYDNALI